MTDLRDAYLAAVDSALDLLATEAVSANWSQQSALAEWTVGGLAGHLAGQVFSVPRVLSAPHRGEAAIPLLEHYARAAWVPAEVDDQVNVDIRTGGDEEAAAGPADLVRRARADRDRVAMMLADQPQDRVVLIPWQGWALTLEDFLVTRMMEIAVHSDDLAASVEVEAPSLPLDVIDPVLRLLTRLALRRHGQSAVLRALTRSERAPRSITAF